MQITRFEANGPFSQVVVAGNTVYIAGQVAKDRTADAAGQAQQILGELDRLLAVADSSKDKLLSVTIYLADITSFSAVNGVWNTWVEQSAKPVRATIEARLAFPDLLVEMQAIACC